MSSLKTVPLLRNISLKLLAYTFTCTYSTVSIAYDYVNDQIFTMTTGQMSVFIARVNIITSSPYMCHMYHIIVKYFYVLSHNNTSLLCHTTL